MSAHTPVQRLILFFSGAVLGLMLWGMGGIGMRELGLLDSFDPIGVTDRQDPIPTAVRLAEAAHWVCAIIGGMLLPPLFTWLLKPGRPSDANSGADL